MTSASRWPQQLPHVMAGAPAAQALMDVCRRGYDRFRHLTGQTIALGIVRVGEDPASSVYVAAKARAAERLGYEFQVAQFAAGTSPEEILALIQDWNRRKTGILIQLPLPLPHNKAQHSYLEAIDPGRDVDGLHPRGSQFMPCTPLGCLLLLEHYGVEVAGAPCVVVGRSALVGRPLGLALLDRNATVTFAHRETEDLPSVTRHAALLAVAAGKKHLITEQHLGPDVIILDIGVHRLAEGGVTGDVAPQALAHARAFTPVPGGVGVMTVAALMRNTLQAACLNAGLNFDAVLNTEL